MLKSLLQASVAASRRAVAWNFNDIAPPAEQLLFRFEQPFESWFRILDSGFWV